MFMNIANKFVTLFFLERCNIAIIIKEHMFMNFNIEIYDYKPSNWTQFQKIVFISITLNKSFLKKLSSNYLIAFIF